MQMNRTNVERIFHGTFHALEVFKRFMECLKSTSGRSESI